MKILFVSSYANNPHYMNLTKKTLDKYLLNITYDYICLNDAPSPDEENYLNICDMLTGENNCYENILETSKKNGFFHIKIPQNIHIKDRVNQGGPRHIENLNWFNINIDTLFPTYKNYDYICHIDSDAFFSKSIDLNKELNGYDMAGPFIYIWKSYYIHTGLFFINIKTVTNMKKIRWDNTMKTDTGSEIFHFIKNNKHYKIKKLGHYDGYSNKYWEPNDHTNMLLDIPEFKDDIRSSLIDSWFNKSVFHFRGGSCFGVGSLKHRNTDNINRYNTKMKYFLKLFE